jgi:hypothetical protein
MLTTFAYGQQTVRGEIRDIDTELPVIMATVRDFTDTSNITGGVSDMDGKFKLQNVPYGRRTLVFSFVGYETKTIEVEVTSGKEIVLNIKLETSAEDLDIIEVTAGDRGAVLNDYATVSSKTFSIEETERYAGGRSDPARLVSNFAGVSGTDDNRNDIVVRGNSPTGVLWKMEGLSIPNPNHFAVAGTTGGPVSALNNKMLDNSDFFMSAYPAQYGNSNSAVFDLRTRAGNNEQFEFSAQFGLLGTEILAEGPLNRKGASYLIMGRYSTLSIFQAIGISIGTTAVPEYWDGAFVFTFPTKRNGKFKLFGLGGMSSIDIVLSDDEEPSEELYGESDRDQHFNTAFGVSGLSYMQSIGKKGLLRTAVGVSYQNQNSQHKYFERHLDPNNKYVLDTIYPLMAYNYDNLKVVGTVKYKHRISRKHIIEVGMDAEGWFFDNRDSVLNPTHTAWNKRWDIKDNTFLLQAFFQYKWKINNKWTMNLGLHSQYFDYSKSWSYVEPRFGLQYKPKANQTFAIGLGMHSQTQPEYLYSYHLNGPNNEKIYHLKDMDFTRSIHVVGSYQIFLMEDLRLKTEIYFQQLYNVPVGVHPGAFSMLNQGSGFQRFFPDSLDNTGTGQNYGLELTLEKFFTKKWFLMFNISLYDSKYKGSDYVTRNTDFNGGFTTNLLIGKEFKFNDKHSIVASTKITWAGGKRYGVVDDSLSSYYQEIVYQDSLYNEYQFKNYFRVDLKVAYKVNSKKVSHELGFDLINIFNIKNVLGYTYAPQPNPSVAPTALKYQLGFLPVFYYRIDFKVQRKNKKPKVIKD